MTDTAKTTGSDDKTADHQAARAGQASKAAWIKAVGADRELTGSTKVVGVMAAFHHGYSLQKPIRATRRYLGRLAGVGDATVKRAIKELTAQKYWTVDVNTGGANIYTIIPPDKRAGLWLTAESEWRREYEKWLFAEETWKKRVEQWLAKEAEYLWLAAEREYKIEFTDAISADIVGRGGDLTVAQRAAGNLWEQHRQGRGPLDEALRVIADLPADRFRELFNPDEPAADVEHQRPDPGSPVTRPQVTNDPTPGYQCADPGSPADRGRVTSNSVTSTNEPSTSSSRSPRAARPVGEIQNEPAPLARSARSAGSPDSGEPSDGEQHQQDPMTASCQLCDADGYLLDEHGDRVEVFDEREHHKYGVDGSPGLSVRCYHDDINATVRSIEALLELFPYGAVTCAGDATPVGARFPSPTMS
jgi:hypothetical protein